MEGFFHKVLVNNGINRDFIANKVDKGFLKILYKYNMLDNSKKAMNWKHWAEFTQLLKFILAQLKWSHMHMFVHIKLYFCI